MNRLALILVLLTVCAAAPAARASEPPDTFIEEGPQGLTAISEPTFFYSSSDYRAEYECRVDQEPFKHCDYASEQIVPALADGPHSFEVRSFDPLEAVGEPDPTPAHRSFTVDATPPTVVITAAPHGLTRDTVPTIYFKATGERRLECSLEPAFPHYEPCTTDRSFTAPHTLPDDSYTFRVRVGDRAGNDANAAHRFRVYTGPGQPPNPYSGSVLYTGGGRGIKVAFRVKHRRIVRANVLVRLNCIGPDRRHHHAREALYFAEPGSALLLDGQGRFREAPALDEEPGLRIEEKLVGRVGNQVIAGGLTYRAELNYRDRDCETGSWPHHNAEPLAFRAVRR